jgi:hypothetical protein
MAQTNSSIGNATMNTGLVKIAIAYSRSRVLCAAARLGVADALGDEVRSVGFVAEKCQADATALYRFALSPAGKQSPARRWQACQPAKPLGSRLRGRAEGCSIVKFQVSGCPPVRRTRA